MISYLAGWNSRKDAVFAALAAVDGGRRLPVIGLWPFGYRETAARVDEAMKRAKKQPRNPIVRGLKRLMIRGQYNWSRRYFSRHSDHVAVCWNGLTGSRYAFMQGARDAGAARLYAELAPLPDRITLDPHGVNAENGLPRDPAFYARWAETRSSADWSDWRAMGQGMTARASRRSDVTQGDGTGLAAAGPFLFCPLQVPDDSQIRLFSGWCGGLAGFLEALAEAARHLPEGWHLRLKEHPSAKQSLADLIARAEARAPGRIVLDNSTDTFAQVAAARAVVTLNSSVGLQAFFHGKPVIVVGEAFFAIPGLVTPTLDAATLSTAFAGAETLGFDQAFRDRFMTYLAEVYYPRASFPKDGPARFDTVELAAKLAEARQVALVAAR